MFASWGRLLAAHRRLVAVVSLMSMVAAIVGMVLISPNLSTDGFVSEQAESARVDETLAREFGHGSDSLVFLFDANRPVSDPEAQQAVEGVLTPITADARFGRVLTT
jgi:predicted RND superfamily exporter protein